MDEGALSRKKAANTGLKFQRGNKYVSKAAAEALSYVKLSDTLSQSHKSVNHLSNELCSSPPTPKYRKHRDSSTWFPDEAICAPNTKWTVRMCNISVFCIYSILKRDLAGQKWRFTKFQFWFEGPKKAKKQKQKMNGKLEWPHISGRYQMAKRSHEYCASMCNYLHFFKISPMWSMILDGFQHSFFVL